MAHFVTQYQYNIYYAVTGTDNKVWDLYNTIALQWKYKFAKI